MQLAKYKTVQKIAKEVHEKLKDTINSRSTEKSISISAENFLKEFDISETWYHAVPALVLLGSRSCLSISGKKYIPSSELVGKTNLVTVDLSPKSGNYWGDCARSYTVENGVVTDYPERSEFNEGFFIQKELHKQMVNYVSPETTFSELFEYSNKLIVDYGYENLDFLRNLGHSIETSLNSRKYIDKDCHESLKNINLFTFEPHIKKRNGNWGFKHEDIYYFNEDGQIKKL